MRNGGKVLLLSIQDGLVDGLLALLATIPNVQRVIPTRRGKEIVRLVGEHKPNLVILGVDRKCHGAGGTIREIHRASPKTLCLVLVEDAEQQNAAQAAGAEAVLFQGVVPDQLVAAIEDLLS